MSYQLNTLFNIEYNEMLSDKGGRFHPFIGHEGP